MSIGENPLVARRRVRLAVRKAREHRGLTQTEVAEAMEWSLSKVIRIENGDVGIQPNDLRPLLAFLEVEKTLADDLQQANRNARARRNTSPWWQAPEFKDHITGPMARLIESETASVASWVYEQSVFPGRLQLPEYAAVLLSNYSDELSPEDIEIRLRVRKRRREDFLKAPNTEHIYMLIDQSVLYRTIGGGPEVLRSQLNEIVRLAEEGRVNTRVIPLDFDGPMPTFGMFELFYLTEDRDNDNAVLYSEDFLRDEISEDRSKIERHRAKLDQLWALALSEEESLELIRTRTKELATRAGSPPRQK
jgi:transcriptional regulator with XRE-family HTH domain